MSNVPFRREILKETKGLPLPKFAYKPPDYTDVEAIEMIRHLPYHVMEHEHGVLLGDCIPDEYQFVSVIVKDYEYLADWLQYYLFKDTYKLQVLNNTERKHYKPIAEKSLATLRLIQEVCAFAPWLNAEKICINRWWLACEWELCEQMLKNSGYIHSPSVIGCNEYYKQAVRLDKLWDKPNVETIDAEIYQTTPIQALEGLATLISKHPDNVLFRTHFDHYRKTIKRSRRTLRDSQLKPTYLIDGKKYLMERGKPGQKRI